VHFVGMMGFVKRSDRSLLVALPGQDPMGHFVHVPFLMARTGSNIATSLGMTSMPGVAAAAFDQRLNNTASDAFVFKCVEGAELQITSGAAVAVDNAATHLAQMHRIAPGKRLRNNLRRWANSAVSLQGGQLANAAAHPDAGKVWSFGSYQQALTDAVDYTAPGAKLRYESGAEVRTFAPGADETAELWVISAAGPRTDIADPKRLEHGVVLFHYLSDAPPVVAYCASAEGRITLATDLPCAPSAVASRSTAAARTYPPYVELCYNGFFGDDE
jgi:hypothetical protein